MNEILGTAKTVSQLLKGVKYSIDYYQREYKWQPKQIRELIDDLTGKFLEEYDPEHPRKKVKEYPHYFLGSIIISKAGNASYIVDGQQRLTSLTLLLILLRTLQQGRPNSVFLDDLIFSEQYGERSFNLRVEDSQPVDERTEVMTALYEGQPFELNGHSESVQNLYLRYGDLEDAFPEDLRDHALPYFIDWLLGNVHIVEITAYSNDDAYMIFETMNDRGLSLSPTDMLKGYLLANIDDASKRAHANQVWRNRIRDLNDAGKEVEPDCFKAWLRSQYSIKIREHRKGARAEDYDRIGTEFHRWLRDAADDIGLHHSDDFYRFISWNFVFYSRQYLRIVRASRQIVPQLEHVLYNAQFGFTLQNMLLLAPLKPDDGDSVALKKQRLVARFVDILLARRIWNFRSIVYSTMQYTMFNVMRETRGLDAGPLAQKLYDILGREPETFASNERLRVHSQNRYSLHRLIARLTDYVETESGMPSRYLEYISEGKTRFEVEHIWADHYEKHLDEFGHPADFAEHRNRIGGLLLVPKKFNASYGDLPYEAKLPHYYSQNLLARSLNPQCYEHNPGFLSFVQRSGLPFRPYTHFEKADLEERGVLYRKIAEQLWNPEDLLREVSA